MYRLEATETEIYIFLKEFQILLLFYHVIFQPILIFPKRKSRKNGLKVDNRNIFIIETS